MTNRVSISHLNNAHTDNLRAIEFYRGEIKILKTRLTEIAGKNTGQEMSRELEHFENAFSVQDNMLSELTHKINANLANIKVEAASQSAGYIDAGLFAEHDDMIEKFAMEERLFNELKHSFNRFASRWM